MKLLLVFAAVLACSAATDVVMCNSMVNETLTAGNCTAGVTQCHSMVNVEYTGLVGEDGCGPCTADAKTAGTCTECTSNSTAASNVAVEVHTFSCFDYTFSANDSKWMASAKAVTCTANKDTPVKCNKPGTAANVNYTVPNTGCGPCAPDTINANTCLECGKDSCNSAAAISVFMAPLIALLYAVLYRDFS